jgi:MFS family permease
VPITKIIETRKGSFRILLRKPGMIRLIFAYLMSMIGMHALTFLYAIIVVDELGGPHFYVGLANSTATLIAVIITGYIGKTTDRYGPSLVLTAAMGAYIIFSLSFALISDPILAMLLGAIPIYPLTNTASFTFAALISGEEERGRAMSIINGVHKAGTALGPIIGGIFAQYVFGIAQSIAWITLFFALIGLLLSLTLHGVNKELLIKSESVPITHSESP